MASVPMEKMSQSSTLAAEKSWSSKGSNREFQVVSKRGTRKCCGPTLCLCLSFVDRPCNFRQWKLDGLSRIQIVFDESLVSKIKVVNRIDIVVLQGLTSGGKGESFVITVVSARMICSARTGATAFCLLPVFRIRGLL